MATHVCQAVLGRTTGRFFTEPTVLTTTVGRCLRNKGRVFLATFQSPSTATAEAISLERLDRCAGSKGPHPFTTPGTDRDEQPSHLHTTPSGFNAAPGTPADGRCGLGALERATLEGTQPRCKS